MSSVPDLSSPHNSRDPKLIFLIRLLGVVILSKFYLHSFQITIPFIPFGDLVLYEDGIQKIVRGIAIVGGILLLLNYQIRLAIGLAIFALGLTILGSMTNYSDGRVFTLYLLIIAFVASFRMIHVAILIRVQLMVMYLGSALNKVWSEGWLTGDYMNFWLFNRLNFNYSVLEFFPAFPFYLGWSVIVVEILIPLLLIFRSTTGLAIGMGLCMHACSLLVAGHTFGAFIPLLCICFALLLDWPEKVIIYVSDHWNQRLKKYDFPNSLFKLIEVQPSERVGFQIHKKSFYGVFSWILLIGILPGFYAALVVILLMPIITPILKGLLVIFFAILWFYIDRVLQSIRKSL